ncbi:hypothetical protein XELAEV_18015393mg [Xenopus laevis]|uniref:Uncharacterized protein n=1 Tax=Xenopus laevis TaxID=8355 RepID=A0A974DJQ7_XENLA|nr:hypothetical protein XELAEV_18015393mg [Xenopus laevis]
MYPVYIFPRLALHLALPFSSSCYPALSLSCPPAPVLSCFPVLLLSSSSAPIVSFCSSLLLLLFPSALYPQFDLIYTCTILSHPVCSCSTPAPSSLFLS